MTSAPAMAMKRKRETGCSPAADKKSQTPNKRTKQQAPVPIPSAPAQPPPPQTSPLLTLLPPELLTHILAFLLIPSPSRPIQLHSAKDRRWRNELSNLALGPGARMPSHYTAPPSSGPASKSPLLRILLVSRAFYFAGTAAFFGGNAFRFASASSLEKMTWTLDIDRRRHIARVVLAKGTRELCMGEMRIGRDAEGFVDVDVVSLREAVERLPALKEVVVDFEEVGRAWEGDDWRRVRARTEGLEGAMGFLEGKVRLGWSLDGRRFDPRKGVLVEGGEKYAGSGEGEAEVLA